MEISGELFFKEAQKVINKLENEQMDNIRRAADVISEAVKKDGVVHVFGSGHSKAFAMELAGRAGGLAMMNPMKLDDLALMGENPMSYEELKDPQTERKPENGLKVLGIHNIKAEDVIILCSNSGRNGAVVEIALEAKRRKMPVIGVTSLKHSSKTSSRHPGGKKLYEVADIVIDNCGPYGDALLEVPGLDAKVCSVSSITNAFIAQALNAEIIQDLIDYSVELPIYISYNIDGADEHNEKIKEKYEGRVLI